MNSMINCHSPLQSRTFPKSSGHDFVLFSIILTKNNHFMSLLSTLYVSCPFNINQATFYSTCYLFFLCVPPNIFVVSLFLSLSPLPDSHWLLSVSKSISTIWIHWCFCLYFHAILFIYIFCHRVSYLALHIHSIKIIDFYSLIRQIFVTSTLF